MSALITVTPVTASDHALLLDVQAEADQRGLILITDGRELAYTLPHHIPAGWTRFAIFDKNAGRLNPREIGSGKT
jgi:hypothetical protein